MSWGAAAESDACCSFDDYDSSFEIFEDEESTADIVPTSEQHAAIIALGCRRYWINFKDGTERYCTNDRKATYTNRWDSFNHRVLVKRAALATQGAQGAEPVDDEWLDTAYEGLCTSCESAGEVPPTLPTFVRGMIGMLAPTIGAASALVEQPSALTPEIVEDRLNAWRQRLMNKSGDRLALDDFMGQESIDDLIDFVCAPLTKQELASSDPEGHRQAIVAWFVDANEHATWTMKPDWFQVWPGDPMWSDNWKRYPLRAPAEQPTDTPKPDSAHPVGAPASPLPLTGACGAASRDAK